MVPTGTVRIATVLKAIVYLWLLKLRLKLRLFRLRLFELQLFEATVQMKLFELQLFEATVQIETARIATLWIASVKASTVLKATVHKYSYLSKNM